jgi:tetratricopeptide (TPR) repeat protein
MFGRLAAVRIKNAEDALSEGRIDDAFGLIHAPEVTVNRRVQKLLRDLAGRFLQRGQDRLLGRHFNEASADFDRAAKCDPENKKVGEWQERARQAMRDDRQAEQDKVVILAVARERLAAGCVAEAEDALRRIPESDVDAAALVQAVARQTAEAKEALAAAGEQLKAGRIGAAIGQLRTVRRLYGKLEGLSEMESKVIDQVLRQADESFKGGRLDRAAQELSLLEELKRHHPGQHDIEEAVHLARESAKALADDRYARASILLGRLSQIGPKAGWVSDVRKHLGVLEEHRRALLEGPLGLLSGRSVPSAVNAGPSDEAETMARPPQRWPQAVEDCRPAAKPKAEARGSLPRRMLLRVDGAGSFLLLRGDRVSIGRAGPGASADLQLISDLAERQADVIRAGEDYFVVSGAGVELAGRKIDHALLQDGDRLRLSKRIRLHFYRPSKKSPAAVLDLANGVRTTGDCRRVVLWSGPLLLGSTRECHVKLPPTMDGAILMERDGQLMIKPMKPGGEALPLSFGVQMQLGELRLTVQKWKDDTGSARVIG